MPDPPRWLADEMLGRLARYLRFLGWDTEYVRGVSDGEVIELARRDGRVLITRDRALARRFQPSQLLDSVEVGQQLSELRHAFPGLDWQVRFDRCTLCNGRLRPWRFEADPWPADVPRSIPDAGVTVWECEGCRHHYWEGTHTAKVRKDISGWLSRETSP